MLIKFLPTPTFFFACPGSVRMLFPLSLSQVEWEVAIGNRAPAALGGTSVLFNFIQQGLRASPCAPDLGAPDGAPRSHLGPE